MNRWWILSHGVLGLFQECARLDVLPVGRNIIFDKFFKFRFKFLIDMDGLWSGRLRAFIFLHHLRDLILNRKLFQVLFDSAYLINNTISLRNYFIMLSKSHVTLSGNLGVKVRVYRLVLMIFWLERIVVIKLGLGWFPQSPVSLISTAAQSVQPFLLRHIKRSLLVDPFNTRLV